MASTSDVCSRANIRIEIKNDFKEAMEVDATEENALSEGEVEDDEEPGDVSEPAAAADEPMVQTKNHISLGGRSASTSAAEQGPRADRGGFEPAVDMFGTVEEEQQKLHDRAQRFGLEPHDCQPSMSDQQLAELHESLGITADEAAATRFEAIHMYGTREMSTEDVFEYFGKYGPASIEWINDESCNVVWLDRTAAARAFHGLSSPVAGMPVSGKCDPFQEPLAHGRSILLLTPTATVPPQPDEEDKENGSDVPHVSQIDSPVPPGYWRLGVAHPKTRHVLLRFARRTDRKPLRAERFSQYYRKYGNPNFGGIRGLISQSRKLRMRQGGRPPPAAVPVVSGDPWGSLAKSWHGDVREREPDEVVQCGVAAAATTITRPGRSILDRLGSGGPHKRAADVADTDQADGEGDDGAAAKKSKVPRMRMYADEEEARVQKVKQLQKIRQLEKIEAIIAQTELRAAAPGDTVPDLRSRIRRQATVKQEPRRPPASQPAPQPDNEQETEEDEEEEEEEEDVNVQQKSKVTVIVKKPSAVVKPTVASTIWSRLDREKQLQLQQEQPKDAGHESHSDSSSEDGGPGRGQFAKALNQRPGFNRDLKARLGLTSEHKSPLRIEINNDHYKKS